MFKNTKHLLREKLNISFCLIKSFLKNNKKEIKKKVEYSLLSYKKFFKIIRNFCLSTNENR